jgi:hypothetical protein
LGEDGYLKVKSVLQPGLRPGRGLQLQSAAYSGLFRIEKVKHEGDTHGQTWTSDIEARPA